MSSLTGRVEETGAGGWRPGAGGAPLRGGGTAAKGQFGHAHLAATAVYANV